MKPCVRCRERPRVQGKGEKLCAHCKGHCRDCGAPTRPRGARGYHPPWCDTCRAKLRRKAEWTCQRCGGAAPVGRKLCELCQATPTPCFKCGGERDGPHAAYCRECFRAYARDWPKRSPDKAKLKSRRRTLKGYGLTLDSFTELLTSQGGVCAGCLASADTATRTNQYLWSNLHVDHCHTTGRVRGILCASCNLALGRVKDKPETLRRLADYLERQR